jgi:arylsulfatase A-like enzyme
MAWFRAIALLLAILAGLGGCARSPETVSPSRPHVLLIFADDFGPHMRLLGETGPATPNIDRIAERGTTFTRAYAQYPQCNQSRTSLLTGLYPGQTGVLDLKTHFRDILPDVTTLPEHFRAHGYATVRVGKIFHQGVPGDIGTDGLDDPRSWDIAVNPLGIEPGLDDRVRTIYPEGDRAPGFGGTLSWLSVTEDEGPLTDRLVTDEAIDRARDHLRAGEGKPLFLAVGYYRPHTPFIAPAPYFERYPRTGIEPVEVPPGDRDDKPVAALADRPHQLEMSDGLKRAAIQAYFASMTYIDDQVGRLLDEYERLGLLNDTIVVFLSDHGYQLGAHGLWQKGDLYEGSTRTPLFIAWPGRLPSGERFDQPVELVDLYPTLVSVAGLPLPGQTLAGDDLVAEVNGEQAGRGQAFSQAWSRADWTRPELRGEPIMGVAVRSARYRYVEWAGGVHGVELYDYVTDPQETMNLAGQEDYAPIVSTLEAAIARFRGMTSP